MQVFRPCRRFLLMILCTQNLGFKIPKDIRKMLYYKYRKIDKLILTIKNGGCIEWRLGEALHNDNGPAVEGFNVSVWWINGRKHRADGPAYIDNSYNLIDGTLCVENTHEEWWFEGNLHRETEPAMICKKHNGIYRAWYHHGQLIKNETTKN